MKSYNSKKFSRVVAVFTIFLASIVSAQIAFGQLSSDDKNQPPSKLMSLIEKAERNEYNVKVVEFCCTENIHGRILFSKINKFINEGDIFTRQNLYKSLTALSKFKAIHPVSIENVNAKLDEEQRIINITYNIQERKKSK